jgi:hypothetical protein
MWHKIALTGGICIVMCFTRVEEKALSGGRDKPCFGVTILLNVCLSIVHREEPTVICHVHFARSVCTRSLHSLPNSSIVAAPTQWLSYMTSVINLAFLCCRRFRLVTFASVRRIQASWTDWLVDLLVLTLLTPWSRVLEKLTGFLLVEKFPTYYGTRRLITAFTRAGHMSLSWASSIQSVPPHSTSWISISEPSLYRLLTFHYQISGVFFVAWVVPKYQSTSEAYSLSVSQQDTFYCEELLAPRPIPKLEDQPLSAVRDRLLNLLRTKCRLL